MWNPSKKTRTISSKILLIMFALIIVFHLLALIQIIPYQYLWGGRLESVEEMYLMESLSLLVNGFFVFCSYQYLKYLNINMVSLWLRIVFGFISAIFFINTIGNLVAITNLETLLATPITALLSVLSFSLALKYENLE